jgi:hypothetical protein
MVMDPVQYANAIVDGTEEFEKRKMWIEIEAMFGNREAEGEKPVDTE